MGMIKIKTRKIMVCATCGSQDVKRDAWAEWDKEGQRWELSETFDHAFCDRCEGETTVEARDEIPETIGEWFEALKETKVCLRPGHGDGGPATWEGTLAEFWKDNPSLTLEEMAEIRDDVEDVGVYRGDGGAAGLYTLWRPSRPVPPMPGD
jgi:hypothetical protein